MEFICDNEKENWEPGDEAIGIEYLDVTAFNPLTVGLNSTKPLIITKNSVTVCTLSTTR